MQPALTLRTPQDECTITQAKARLIQLLRVDEPSAYALLRKAAMDQRRPLVQVARAFLHAGYPAID